MIRLLSILFAVLLLLGACTPTQSPSATTTPPVSATPAPAAVPTLTSNIPPPTSSFPLPASQEAWAQIEAAAKKEGRLNAYSFSLIGEAGIKVASAFRQRYGITMDIITAPGASIAERIKVEKRAGQTYADFHDGSAVNLQNMKTSGLLTPVYNDLPVSREKAIWHLEPSSSDPGDAMILAFVPVYFNPYINTNLVKPGQEPKTYKDFLDPKWQGKLSIADPSISPGPYQMLVPLLEKNIVTEDYIKALGQQQLRFFTTITQEMAALSRGEHLASVRGSDAQASAFVQEKAPIKAIGLTEGTLVTVRAISAIDGAPHPNAAKLFMNWLLGPEGQAVYTKSLGMAPVRKDVADARPEGVKAPATSLILVTSEHDAKAAKLFTDKWLLKLWGK